MYLSSKFFRYQTSFHPVPNEPDLFQQAEIQRLKWKAMGDGRWTTNILIFLGAANPCRFLVFFETCFVYVSMKPSKIGGTSRDNPTGDSGDSCYCGASGDTDEVLQDFLSGYSMAPNHPARNLDESIWHKIWQTMAICALVLKMTADDCGSLV